MLRLGGLPVIKGKAVKVTRYIGPDGKLVRKPSEAQLFSDDDLADVAAEVANGQVVDILIPSRKPAAPPKPVKSNQSWMKELKK